MYTFLSREILIESGVPSLLDIAVQLGRLPRWVGATQRFFPVLLHCFVVADLLPKELRVYGLLHDASELWFGDIPGPAKPKIVHDQETKLMRRVYRSLGIRFPGKRQSLEIKRADLRSRIGEKHVLGINSGRTPTTYLPRDFGISKSSPDLVRDPQAERLVAFYSSCYSDHRDYLEPDGRAVRAFVRRVSKYL